MSDKQTSKTFEEVLESQEGALFFKEENKEKQWKVSIARYFWNARDAEINELKEEIKKRDGLLSEMLRQLNKIEDFAEEKSESSIISGYRLISAIVKNFKIHNPSYKYILNGVKDEQ